MAFTAAGLTDTTVRLLDRVGDRTVTIASTLDSSVYLGYEGATPDGSTVFFTYRDVIPGSGAPADGGLYAASIPANGQQADVTYKFVGSYGVAPPYSQASAVAIAQSGAHLYYVDRAGDGTNTLLDYDRAAGTSSAVGDLSAADVDALQNPIDVDRKVRVSPDGRFLLFSSSANGLGSQPYDTGGTQQLFLYDAAGTGGPTCVSCRPDGAAADADAVLTYFGTRSLPDLNKHVPTRNVSDDGRRVFFTTTARLIPDEDQNDKVDVYEWTAGHLYLISTGTSTADSYFLDASASGDDVFFTSFESAAGVESDGAQAIYDARVGAPPPPGPPPAGCQGDGCRGPLSGAPSNLVPTSPLVGPTTHGRNDVPKAGAAKPRAFAVRRARVSTTSATLRVSVPGAGKIRARGSGVRTARRTATSSAIYNLEVKLSGASRSALTKRRRVTLRVRVDFVPRKGKAVSKTVTLRISRAKR